jgi:hypothetical protein
MFQGENTRIFGSLRGEWVIFSLSHQTLELQHLHLQFVPDFASDVSVRKLLCNKLRAQTITIDSSFIQDPVGAIRRKAR